MSGHRVATLAYFGDKGTREHLTEIPLDAIAACIPIERATAPVLLQAGTEDALWPTAEMSTRLMESLEADGAEHQVELKLYPLDHFVGSSPTVRADAIAFLGEALARTCPSGAADGGAGVD